MRTYLLLLILCTSAHGRAQLLDSIALFAKEPPRSIVRLDLKGSFVSNRNVRMAGVKLGWEHARRFQYGVGYSFLFTPIIFREAAKYWKRYLVKKLLIICLLLIKKFGTSTWLLRYSCSAKEKSHFHPMTPCSIISD